MLNSYRSISGEVTNNELSTPVEYENDLSEFVLDGFMGNEIVHEVVKLKKTFLKD